MNRLYTTDLTVQDSLKILTESLKKPSSSYWWWNDIFIGKVKNNRYTYTFHKANIRNSFKRNVSGIIYSENGKTFIKAKLGTQLLSVSYRFGIWGIILSILPAVFVSLSPNEAFINLLRQFSSFLIFIAVSTFISGFATNCIPVSMRTQDTLFGFIEQTLSLTEIDRR